MPQMFHVQEMCNNPRHKFVLPELGAPALYHAPRCHLDRFVGPLEFLDEPKGYVSCSRFLLPISHLRFFIPRFPEAFF